MYRNLVFVFISLVFFVTGIFGTDIQNHNVTENPIRENKTVNVQNLENNSRQSKAINFNNNNNNAIYAGLITCAYQYDAGCFVDVAQNYLELKKRELLAQADQQVARASGNSDPSNKPSQIATSLEKLMSDLASLFREGLSGFFGGKDDDDDEALKETKEEEDDVDDDDTKDDTSRDVGARTSSLRGKKKKKTHPIAKLVHKLLLFGVIVTVLIFILRFFYAALAGKYYLLHLGYFILHFIKYWIWIKNYKKSLYHHEEEPVHYSVQHDHEHEHYGGYDYEDHVYGSGGFHQHDHIDSKPPNYWGREDNAHNLAYSKQKPIMEKKKSNEDIVKGRSFFWGILKFFGFTEEEPNEIKVSEQKDSQNDTSIIGNIQKFLSQIFNGLADDSNESSEDDSRIESFFDYWINYFTDVTEDNKNKTESTTKPSNVTKSVTTKTNSTEDTKILNKIENMLTRIIKATAKPTTKPNTNVKKNVVRYKKPQNHIHSHNHNHNHGNNPNVYFVDDGSNTIEGCDLDGIETRALRKKKNGPIHKLIKLIHLGILGLFGGAAVIFLFRSFYAFLALKYWVLKAKYFVMYAIRVLLRLKNSYYPHHGYIEYEPSGYFKEVDHPVDNTGAWSVKEEKVLEAQKAVDDPTWFLTDK